MATHSFPVPTHSISTPKMLNEATTRANIFTCLVDNAYQGPFANMKMEHQRGPEMSLILGRSGTQYVALVTKLLSS